MNDTLNPFALSLSKPVLSDAAGGVEGGCTFLQGGQGFDKLSPNGFSLEQIA
ncbi:hypothetical protein [Sphingobium sp. YR768]|uniref:hypothetical protein n=1 Tax=Sphingobium sp. YR768 TaxID=1884365 RepID=UPI0008BDE77E|nr:hypothetical protein [Sphingobium sp. YR768]SEQ49833.1 hypothetical protein SAMN05518866_101130 [Sphingobium sp. YR768]